MKKTILIILAITAILFSACSVQETSNNNENNKPQIATSFFITEEITKEIVKDTADVNLLIPIGSDPHSFEPTPNQIVQFSKSDVFITMGYLFEEIENKVINTNSNINIIESTHDVELIEGDGHSHDHEHEQESDEHHEEENHEEHEHENHEEEHHENEEHEHNEEYDPHIWLSIHNMKSMTKEITNELIALYPENKELYEKNSQEYLEKLEELEQKFNEELANCKQDKVIVNHKAFGYLAHEYNFEQISVAGFSPESEPTPKTIQTVIDEAKEHNLKYIFIEEQLDSKTTKTIADEIGGEILTLQPIKIDKTQTYIQLMEENLINLKKGLECNN